MFNFLVILRMSRENCLVQYVLHSTCIVCLFFCTFELVISFPPVGPCLPVIANGFLNVLYLWLDLDGHLHYFKGTQAWIFFVNFFDETAETLWSQGPVTRDFWKSYSIRPRYSSFKHFRACSACDEIGSAYAQHAIKSFPRMLSMRIKLQRFLNLRYWSTGGET